jgi:DNA-binding NtrC family response regulator
MNTTKILIVSDAENQPYWNALVSKIEEQIGPVRLIQDKEISRWGINLPYDVILVDVSNLADLHRLIPKIHHQRPESRIIIVSSSLTWKQAREIFHLGAANLIRRSPDLDELIKELQPV